MATARKISPPGQNRGIDIHFCGRKLEVGREFLSLNSRGMTLKTRQSFTPWSEIEVQVDSSTPLKARSSRKKGTGVVVECKKIKRSPFFEVTVVFLDLPSQWKKTLQTFNTRISAPSQGFPSSLA